MNKKVIKELIFDLPNKEEFFLVHKPFQEDVKSVDVCASVFDDNFITISIKSKFQNKHSPENFVLEYDLHEEHCYLIYESEYDHSEIIECGRKCASKLENYIKSKEKETLNEVPHKMDLYTLIEKLKDIQSRCENEGKGVEVVVENDCEEFHAYSVDTYDNIVFLDVKE
jgi:hypothetical protein